MHREFCKRQNMFGLHENSSAYLRSSFPTISLTCMHDLCILMHMRTTLNIDENIINKASELTGIKGKTTLVRLGLQALIAQESSKRLAKLGGTEKSLRPIPRRRSTGK